MKDLKGWHAQVWPVFLSFSYADQIRSFNFLMLFLLRSGDKQAVR
jgi:hypothetical protein